jgi:hypothetical protein
MKKIAHSLRQIVDLHVTELKKIPASKFEYKLSPTKWSKKEIIGHLVDSAQSNMRRFVMGQYQDNPHIVYDQNRWVAANGYQSWNSEQLIDLWYLLNVQVSQVLELMPAEMKDREVSTESVHSIEWLASDYVKHLAHHLHQVLELEVVPYP